MKFHSIFPLAALVFALVTSPASHAQTVVTTNPYLGVAHKQVSLTTAQSESGRAHSYNAFIIDLSAPGISFKTSPGLAGQPGRVRTQRTRDFVNQEGAQLGINANFFEFQSNVFNFGGTLPYDTDLINAAASNGNLVNTFAANGSVALNISEDNVATMLTGGVGGTTDNAQGISLYNTVAPNGTSLLVNNGTINASPTGGANRRTGLAITGVQELIMLTSESLNFFEMGSAFLFLSGNDMSMQGTALDGGGSTSMYLRDPISGNLNALAASDRTVGNSLVVFAIPEPGSALLIFLAAVAFLSAKRRSICVAQRRTNSV